MVLLLPGPTTATINYRRRHCPMLRSHRTHFFFGICFTYLSSYRMGGYHVISKCSPHDVYVGFFHSSYAMLALLGGLRRECGQTQVSPKRIEMNDCVHLCGYASRRLGLRCRRVRRSLAALAARWANGCASIWQRNKKCDKWVVANLLYAI